MDTRHFELNAPDVIAETIEGEVMVMNLRQGVYYSVTGAGAAAWPALVGGASADVLADGIAQGYRVDAMRVEADLAGFLTRLLDERVLRERAAAPTDVAAIDLPMAVSYPGFGYERFDDMQAMLIIDPVHEVGEFGWPQAAPDKR